jgi:hypothetical protein
MRIEAAIIGITGVDLHTEVTARARHGSRRNSPLLLWRIIGVGVQ